MANDRRWVSVTRVMQEGAVTAVAPFMAAGDPGMTVYLQRLNDLEKIKNREIHAVVVDIFNAVNSGGTKLSKGDLALAKICAAWPEARNEMRGRLDQWRKQGFSFELDWLLRCITAVLTKQARFEQLEHVQPASFADGLERVETLVDRLLNLLSGRLGLDHDRVMAGRYALAVMCCYLDQAGGKLTDRRDQDRLLYWYVHSFMWGRYTG